MFGFTILFCILTRVKLIVNWFGVTIIGNSLHLKPKLCEKNIRLAVLV